MYYAKKLFKKLYFHGFKAFPVAYDKIIKIIVELSNNGRKIEYFIDTKNGSREVYTEYTVPLSVVELMNKNSPIYHEKDDTRELIVYGFIGGKKA